MQENCFLYSQCNHIDCDKDFCLRRYKLESLYTAALIPESKRKHITLFADNDGTDNDEFMQLAIIEADISNFVKDGRNLFLYSAIAGNGKSSWAYRLLEAYFNTIWPKSDLVCRALFISVPRFLLSLKENIDTPNDYAKYIKDNILTADIVVWDDICNKMGTEYEISNLLSFIDARIAAGKSNIYTSNLGPKAVYDSLGERLGSRICNLSTNIELHGMDKRQLMVQQQQAGKKEQE